MYTTITVKQILERKGYDVWTIDAESSAYDALRRMAEVNIGALLVVEDEQVVGIFSERDYARKLALSGRNEKDTPVNEIMTYHVIGVKIHQKIDECLALMTEKFIRHLPVIDEDRQIVGIISIGDLVKEITAEQAFIIDQLVQYIAGEQRKPLVPEKSEVEFS